MNHNRHVGDRTGMWWAMALNMVVSMPPSRTETSNPLRTGQLQRLMPLAPERTLSRQLRKLEQDGIVNRTVHPEVPPHVEYRLTPLGETLEALVTGMNAWGKNYPSTTPQDTQRLTSRD